MLRPLAPAIALGLAAGLVPPLASTPAAANRLKSLYTTVELKACRKMRRMRDGAAWLCTGLGGMPVYVAEGDLRQFISAGARPEKRRAATQTLAPFNTMFEPGSDRATLEWRFDRRGERQIPYAIIVRFHTQRESRKGDVLVVLKVSDRDSCHLAHIDALANPDAIALARRIADAEAKGFDCRSEPRVEGATGRSPM
jgi:hypothetical protein